MIFAYQRVITRAAARAPYRPGAGDRFDRLVRTRRSWSFAFCAQIAGLTGRRFP